MITADDTTRRTPGLANVRILGRTVRRRLRESGLQARRSKIEPILKQRYRTSRLAWARAHRVCMSPTVVEAEVLWSELEFVMMVALSSKFSRNVKCREIQGRYS